MNKVKIITDSTNDLTAEILGNLGISVVPLFVDFGEESYQDGIDITPEKLFKLVKEKKTLPKTAAPSPYDFVKYFKKYIDEGYDIVAVTISSQMSSTYQNAVLAAAEFPEGRIKVVDSRSLSSGVGSVAMIASQYAAKGMSAGEIANKLEEIIPKVKVGFVIDTLEYLYKGGRCNVLQSIVGSMLKVRPIIRVVEGRMILSDKVRGEKKKALDKMLADAVADKDNIDFNRIIITHSLGSEEEAEYLKKQLSENIPGQDIYITQAGCVISSHCGTKTIGIIYVNN